jgi:hypothetical protein
LISSGLPKKQCPNLGIWLMPQLSLRSLSKLPAATLTTSMRRSPTGNKMEESWTSSTSLLSRVKVSSTLSAPTLEVTLPKKS